MLHFNQSIGGLSHLELTTVAAIGPDQRCCCCWFALCHWCQLL